MAKATIMDDLFALGAKLPWKLSLVLAIGSAIGLHQLSLIAPPASSGLQGLSKVVFVQAARVFGLFGQYLVPAALLFGALGGFMQRRRGKDLLAQARSQSNGLPALSWPQLEQLVDTISREEGFQIAKSQAQKIYEPCSHSMKVILY